VFYTYYFLSWSYDAGGWVWRDGWLLEVVVVLLKSVIGAVCQIGWLLLL
jgi:hypothetical protein